jgi:hypothetical protein
MGLTLAGAGCGPDRRPPEPPPPAAPTAPGAAPAGFAVLVFTRTAGFRHPSIQDGLAAIRGLGQRHRFAVDDTADPARIGQGLARYRAVVFLSTTGDLLDPGQQAALERYLPGRGRLGRRPRGRRRRVRLALVRRAGRDLVPAPPARPAGHRPPRPRSRRPGRQAAGARERSDEWYDFRANPRRRVRVLATLDESTYAGGGMGADHPIAWCQEYDAGRSWYSAMGHTGGSFRELPFLAHLLAGIRYAAGQTGARCNPGSSP